MGAMEVILILFGAVIFIGSFLIPAGKKVDNQGGNTISEDTIKEMVNQEIKEAKSQISDIVDETITYAMEKTERSMDRITNEKMLAMNEYSDTILEQINKNHKEVVFLYDMLNDKQESLKATVTEASKTANEVKQTVKDAELVESKREDDAQFTSESKQPAEKRPVDSIPEPKEFTSFIPPKISISNTISDPVADKTPVTPSKASRKPRTVKQEKEQSASLPEVEITLNATGKMGGRNSNERILQLHKAGKSNMAIAKELGLGIGEVKLVIDLFEGI